MVDIELVSTAPKNDAEFCGEEGEIGVLNLCNLGNSDEAPPR
jgi:hypothetical protein